MSEQQYTGTVVEQRISPETGHLEFLLESFTETYVTNVSSLVTSFSSTLLGQNNLAWLRILDDRNHGSTINHIVRINYLVCDQASSDSQQGLQGGSED